MDHHDHVELIRRGVEGAGPRWLELGPGEGAFTLALADLLGASSNIVALDRDARSMERMHRAMRERFPATDVQRIVHDFTVDLPAGPFDGILAANSLHFVRDRGPLLEAIRVRLATGGRLVIVEYDADRGNHWVPHPFSFATWRADAVAAGFAEPELTGRVPSRFLGAMYGAVTTADEAGMLRGLTATTERSTAGTAPERVRDGASRAGPPVGRSLASRAVGAR